MHTGYVSLSKLPRTKFNCIHLNLHSLQKNTQLAGHVGQKVTTNPKLGQNRKSRSTEEADLSFDCFQCYTIFFTNNNNHTISTDRVEQKKGHNKSETKSKL